MNKTENSLEHKLREKKPRIPGIGVHVINFCLSFGLGFYAEPVVATFLPYFTPYIPKRYYPELTVVVPTATIGAIDLWISEDKYIGLISTLATGLGITLGMYLGRVYR